MSCQSNDNQNASPATLHYTVTEQTIEHPLFFSGTLAPLTVVNVPAPVDGFVITKNFEYGQRVEKGQVLVKLHSEQLQKDYNAALTAYLKSKQELSTSQSKVKSDAELFRLGIISKETYHQSESAFHSNRVTFLQSVNTLKEALQKGGVDFKAISNLDISNIDAVDKALKQDYNHLEVAALTSGVALMPQETQPGSTDKHIMIGSKVETGQVIVSIGDLSGLSVSIEISENEVTRIRPGSTVDITSSAFPHLDLHGIVESVDSEAKPVTNYGQKPLPTFGAKIIVPKLSPLELQKVRVGMTAKIEVHLPKVKSVMIPIAAVTEKQGHYFVEALKDDEKKTMPIEIGETTDSLVEVEKGLNPGDIILVPEKVA